MKELESNINSKIKLAVNWFNKNKFTLNVKKKIIFFQPKKEATNNSWHFLTKYEHLVTRKVKDKKYFYKTVF